MSSSKKNDNYLTLVIFILCILIFIFCIVYMIRNNVFFGDKDNDPPAVKTVNISSDNSVDK